MKKIRCRIHASCQLIQQGAGIRCSNTQLHQTDLSIPNIDSQRNRRFGGPLGTKIQVCIQNTPQLTGGITYRRLRTEWVRSVPVSSTDSIEMNGRARQFAALSLRQTHRRQFSQCRSKECLRPATFKHQSCSGAYKKWSSRTGYHWATARNSEFARKAASHAVNISARHPRWQYQAPAASCRS